MARYSRQGIHLDDGQLLPWDKQEGDKGVRLVRLTDPDWECLGLGKVSGKGGDGGLVVRVSFSSSGAAINTTLLGPRQYKGYRELVLSVHASEEKKDG